MDTHPQHDDPAATGDDGRQEIREGHSLVNPLPEDNQTPFNEPVDPIADPTEEIEVREEQLRLSPTHPDTDSASNLDSYQLYDAGLAAAAESSEPNRADAVVNFDPAKARETADEPTEEESAA